jgi:hypothetical protein
LGVEYINSNVYEIAEKSPPEQQSINTSEDWKERKNQKR